MIREHGRSADSKGEQGSQPCDGERREASNRLPLTAQSGQPRAGGARRADAGGEDSELMEVYPC